MSQNINQKNNNQITSILIASALGNKDIVKLLLDLGSNIFTCGQSYTALSRAKKLSSIKIIDIDKDSFRTNIDVKKFYKNCNK